LKESDRIRNYDEDEYELSKSYLKLIEKLWETNRESQYDPYNFKNVVNSYDKSFNKSNSDKIKDFIDFILEQLHRELKIEKINKKKLKQNDSNKEIIYKNFLDHIENSIISEEFFGIVENSYKCLECNNNLDYYNYEILKYIIFNLEEIKSIINSNNNDSNNNKIKINDCFNTLYNNNIFIRENNYFCYSCNKLTRCKYYSKLLNLPNTLIIILNRNINKINPIEFDFHNEIKIDNFLVSSFLIQKNYENNENQNISYELYGVVTCINQNEPTEQHFVAFCKCSINNKWYKYDDIEVIEIGDSINIIQKDIIEYKTPIILFYKRF
jgi:ubiquitin C-terminal hydrolase